MHVCMYACMYVCMRVCMRVCMCMYVRTHTHLCCGILHGHPVWSQEEIRLPFDNILVLGIIDVTVHHFLREGKGFLESWGGGEEWIM